MSILKVRDQNGKIINILAIKGEKGEGACDHVVTPKQFGALADGQTDDTQALKNMCEYVNERGYGKIVFDKGTYKVSIEDRTDYGFENRPSILSFLNANVEIDLQGSSIVLDTNNSPFYSVFHFKNCGFKVMNGTLTGDRLSHDYSAYNDLTTHEWGHGVHNEGSKGYIENLEISEFTGDGISSGNNISWEPFTVLSRAFINVDGCNIHHCRRQGITVGESDGAIIKNTEIHHIGTFDNIKGAAPMSGIDLEFELGENRCDKVILDNINIYDCTKYSIVGANNDDVLNNLYIINSFIQGKTFIIVADNFTIENTTLNLKSIDSEELSSDIRKCKFSHCNILLYVNGHHFSDNIFNNCSIEGLFNDETSEGTKIVNYTTKNNIFNDCIIKNISGNLTTWPGYSEKVNLRGFDNWVCNSEYIFNNCDIENIASISKTGNTKNLIFNSCKIKNSGFYNESSNEIYKFNDCTIENIMGYLLEKPMFFFNCNISDDGTNGSNSFVCNGKAILHNCILNITKTTTGKSQYNIRAYNSYLNYTNPTDATFENAKLYNCFISCNTPEASFTGTKENTTYVEK